MLNLKLYEAKIIDTEDSTKKRLVKIRILPEHIDVRDSDLPWAAPFTSVHSADEMENDLPQKDSIIYVLVDSLFKRFYYLQGKFFYNLFDYSKVESALSNASSISDKNYNNIKFRLYEDGGLEFHNKKDGSHGFIHKSGSYSIFDKDGNCILDVGSKEVKINATGKVVIDGQNIELNGNTKNFVTHAELNTALQTMLTTLNSQLGLIAGGATAAIAASGLWLTPLTIGGLTLNIASSKTNTVKTG